MQLYAAKRKGDLLMTTVVHLVQSAHRLPAVSTITPKIRSIKNSTMDQRLLIGAHVFALTYTYTLKMFSRTRGFVKAVLDGYEVSGITRFQSGPYLTVTAQGTGAANGCIRKPSC